jgi:uncharacterized protein with HEPN domain
MKNYKEYARHILDEIKFIEKECGSLSFSSFIENELLTRAVVRSIEIIGEAVKNIPSEILEKYPDVEWKNIARARDKLIHHYFGVDYYIIWDIIKNHIPLLKTAAEKITDNVHSDI